MQPEFELSIVIPTLNEEQIIHGTLDNLAAQKGVRFEVIISDGGSSDATCDAIAGTPLSVATVTGKAGRATQLNAGAAVVSGEFILFLHADSRFNDRDALRKGLDALRRSSGAGGKLTAGHFRLNFARSDNTPSFAYSFLEAKARIDRQGCAHGDQGILIAAGHFRESGGFDESCQFLAETRFADRLRSTGEWLLLPAEIHTSARRFELEGLKKRLIFNAIIMALSAAGRDDILARIPELYRNDFQKSRLTIRSLSAWIMDLVAALPEKEQSEFWERIGKYLAGNVWQIALFLDELKRFCGMGPENKSDNPLLALHERYLERRLLAVGLIARTSSLAGRFCTTLLLLSRRQGR